MSQILKRNTFLLGKKITLLININTFIFPFHDPFFSKRLNFANREDHNQIKLSIRNFLKFEKLVIIDTQE